MEYLKIGCEYDVIGRMTSRSNALLYDDDPIKEVFSHDATDRLFEAKEVTCLPNNTSTSRNLFNINYNQNRIASHSAVGDYSYDHYEKPHALTEVELYDENTISLNQCNISYNLFNKVKTINEGDYHYEVIYYPNKNQAISVLKENDTEISKKQYAGKAFEIDYITDKKYFYIYAHGQPVAVFIQEGEDEIEPYFIHTDHLGSIDVITDANGNIVDQMSFDAWGNRRDRHDWTQGEDPNIVHLIDRGFTDHQHLDVFNLINMGGRVYDPIVGQFFSPDPYVADATNTQDYNRYSYARNNPLAYIDPTGEFIFTVLSAIFCPPLLPAAIGADIGMWQGGSIANGTMNPLKWDWSSCKTWGYVLGGAAVGAASGYLGASVAAGGGLFANTMGIATASYVHSLGMNILTGGQTPMSISFGAVSYNFDMNEWGYLGKKGNTWYENLGYGFGALANLTDVVSLFGGGTSYDINSARTNTKQGDEWWGHSSGTGDGINISVGPGANDHATKMDYFKTIDGIEWPNYADQSGTWSIRVNNVNQKILQGMTKNIENGNGLFFGDLKWNLVGQSCVNHTARSLWAVGVPTLPINLHPHILNFQLLVRQLGIYSSPYLYNIR